MDPRRHARMGNAATARDDDPGMDNVEESIGMRGRLCVVEQIKHAKYERYESRVSGVPSLSSSICHSNYESTSPIQTQILPPPGSSGPKGP